MFRTRSFRSTRDPSRWWNPQPGSDRGDVPGWVLVTVMTAGLVSALWIVADQKLSEMFTAALGAVTGS